VGLGSMLFGRDVDSFSSWTDSGRSEAIVLVEEAGAGEGSTAEDFRRGMRESRTWPK
jgi:hypothetical protein